MKKIIILFLFLISNISSAQDNTLTVVASGSGLNETEAINDALRNCIEKTYGVFISVLTEVENDKLVKDEISTIAQGTISEYQVISSRFGGKEVIVSARVSPSKVVEATKAKGYDVKLNGSVYAQNAMKEEFYKNEEPKALNKFLSKYFDMNFFEFKFTINPPVNYKSGDTNIEVLNQAFLDELESHYAAIREKFELRNKRNALTQRLPKLGGDNYAPNLHFQYTPQTPQDSIPWSFVNHLPQGGVRIKSKESNIQLIEILALASLNQNYVEFVETFYNFLDQISIKDVEGYKKTSGNPQQIEFYGGIEKLNKLAAKTFYLRSSTSLDFIENFFNLVYISSTALYITSGVFDIADEAYCELPSYHYEAVLYNVLTERSRDYFEVTPYFRKEPFRNNVSSYTQIKTFTGSRFLLFFSLENLNKVNHIELKPREGIK